MCLALSPLIISLLASESNYRHFISLPSSARDIYVVTDIINVLCCILLYCVGFSAFLSTSAIVLSTFVRSLLCKIHIRIKTLRWRSIFRPIWRIYRRRVFATSLASLLILPLYVPPFPIVCLARMCYIANLMYSPISLIKVRTHR